MENKHTKPKNPVGTSWKGKATEKHTQIKTHLYKHIYLKVYKRK